MADLVSKKTMDDLSVADAKAGDLATGEEIAARLHDHMANKTVVITGVSPTGLGAEAARVIALHQPKLLLLASRSPAAIAEVIADLQRQTAGQEVSIEAVALDLADWDSVRAAAAHIRARTPAVDVLINNAGVMMLQSFEPIAVPGHPAGGPGIERQFATNHLGHFFFTNLLMPALLASSASPGARVVTIASRGYIGSPVVALDDPALLDDTPANREAYRQHIAYAQSKTANMLFALGLARKLGSRGLRSYSVDPGAIGTTQLSRHIPMSVQIQLGWRLQDGSLGTALPWVTAEQSIGNYIKAAYDPEISDHNGASIMSQRIDDDVLPYACDPVLADRLWTLSEKLVGQEFQY